jgi:hypothetical protein
VPIIDQIDKFIKKRVKNKELGCQKKSLGRGKGNPSCPLNLPLA